MLLLPLISIRFTLHKNIYEWMNEKKPLEYQSSISWASVDPRSHLILDSPSIKATTLWTQAYRKLFFDSYFIFLWKILFFCQKVNRKSLSLHQQSTQWQKIVIMESSYLMVTAMEKWLPSSRPPTTTEIPMIWTLLTMMQVLMCVEFTQSLLCWPPPLLMASFSVSSTVLVSFTSFSLKCSKIMIQRKNSLNH